jgi:hypothetical protein
VGNDKPFKAGTTTPTNDCVAERQWMPHRQQCSKKSFMRRSTTPWMLVARFRGVKATGDHRTSLREERQLRFDVVFPEDETGVATA